MKLKKKTRKRIEELIEKGSEFTFIKNSYESAFGRISRQSSELLAWIATVGDFIKDNYGKDSNAYNIFSNYNPDLLIGSSASEYSEQIAFILGALKSCKETEPKSGFFSSLNESNQIVGLLKNPYFYGTLVLFIGASFTLGQIIGGTKFDNEKNLLLEENNILKLDTLGYKKIIREKDSLINALEIQKKTP